MSKERSIKNWYRDPQNAVIGGVCAGIAESASIDTLLVRVTAIALCFVTFGLAIVLYLVLFAILPIKPSSGSFIDLEPSRVQSERYRRVVNLSKAVPILGGLIGATVDAVATNTIGNMAVEVFVRELVVAE